MSHTYCVVVKDMDEVVKFSNAYAPEHLIVNVEDPESLLPNLDNAGSIFMGRYTPESVGDYASGTNHVLPTYGFSRMYSGVSLDSFVKYMTVQELTKEGLDALGPHVARMAAVEGLDAHRSAVTLRLARMWRRRRPLLCPCPPLLAPSCLLLLPTPLPFCRWGRW